MNQQEINIKQLLERFMKAETSEAEEEELARYFRTTQDIPEEWNDYREMFGAFDDDALAFSEEELNEVIAEAEEPTKSSHPTKKIWMYSSIAGIAAAAILVFLLMRPSVPEPSNPVVAETPVEQMQEADSAHITTPEVIAPTTAVAEVKEDKTPQQVAKVQPTPSAERQTSSTVNEEEETVEVITITDASQLASNIEMPTCDAECQLEQLRMASMQMMGDTYYEKKL